MWFARFQTSEAPSASGALGADLTVNAAQNFTREARGHLLAQQSVALFAAPGRIAITA